ncbi:alpha/beta hydrolase [Hyphomonas sp. WL0036]|uniref:alpha/beta fold hydrolase n=1 Tax=Hyphomonas sediminis TaxID=2866160 RepID=UPI001C81F6F2|nr:alpha/beta hydrolase [Hyphomonas sediminis]MBY9066505.1 alpha/beta hydrolase [Hyphomonas sediminis]
MLPDGTDISWESADGLRLYAKSYGPQDAPLTVLCIHGLTRNHKDFEPMIAALPQHYRYISVDVRGRGQSTYDPNPDNYAPPVYAKDMIALLDHLGVSKVATIGTSMGGLISLILARQAPERLIGVTLNDVGPEVDKAGIARIATYAGKARPVTSWETAADAVKATQGVAFPDLPAERWLDFARRTYRELPTGEFIADYDPNIAASLGKVKPGRLMSFVMWRLFGAMKKIPLLIIRGGTSDILAASTADRMVRRHPDARLVTVPQVGHAPLLDEPEAIAALTEFLRRLETKA